MGLPSSRSRILAARGRAIDQADFAGAVVDQAHQHGARAAARADHDNGAGIGAPCGLCLAHAFDIAERIVVLPDERSIVRDNDAVHGADTLRQRINLVDDVERGLLVRNGQVAAGETQRRKRPQRSAQARRLDRKRQIGAGEAVLRQPVIVQPGRARMHHGIAHHAGQQETIRICHTTLSSCDCRSREGRDP